MKRAKRSWTLAEKSLFAAPLLIVGIAGALWWRQQNAPRTIPLPAPARLIFWQFSPDSRKLLLVDDRNGQGAAPWGAGRKLYGAVIELDDLSKVCELKMGGSQYQSTETPYFSPDGKRIVLGYDTADGPNQKPSRVGLRPVLHGEIAVWNAQTGQLMARWPYAPQGEDAVAKFQFSRDGRHLLGYGRPVSVFDSRSGARLSHIDWGALWDDPMAAWSGTFDWSENFFAARNKKEDKFQVRDLRSGQVVWQPKTRITSGVRWAQNGVLGVLDTLSSSPFERRLLLWDSTQKLSLDFLTHLNALNFVLNDHQPLVAIKEVRNDLNNEWNTRFDKLSIWNYQTGRPAWSWKTEGNFYDMRWSPDGKKLAVAERTAAGKMLRIFSTSGEILLQKSLGDEFNSLMWSPDSNRLALAEPTQVEILKFQSAR